MEQKYSLPARLKAARKAAGFKTLKEFVEAHKIPPSTYSQHETGRRMPNDEFLQRYAKLLQVNLNWLKLGKGDPYTSKQETINNKNILQEELLDLSEWKSAITPTAIIQESLLAEILKQLLESHTTTALSVKTIANAAAGIYADIVSVEPSPAMQIKLVRTAVLAFKRYLVA